MAESEFSLKNGRFGSPPLIFWGTDFHGVPPLTDNTAKTSVGEDSVKIRTAVAQQSCKKTQE